MEKLFIFKFDILQWNCKGLRTRCEDLKILLNNHNPGVVCLQETKLDSNIYNPGLDYEIYSNNTLDGDRAHGGVAININKSLHHSVISLNAIRSCFEQETIFSLYFHQDLDLV